MNVIKLRKIYPKEFKNFRRTKSLYKYPVKLSDIFYSYYKARKHKKYAKDVKEFDLYFENKIVKLIKSIRNGKYNAKLGNYCFVVYRPNLVKYLELVLLTESFIIS